MGEQMELSSFIPDVINYEVKPLIYSLSTSCFKTVCPYCKAENPDSTDMNDCTKRDHIHRELKNFYPYFDLPLDYCPACGKKFDTNCEVRMTKGFMDLNPEYVAKLHKDDKVRWRQE